MSAPGPDATREEVAAYLAKAKKDGERSRRSHAALHVNSRCSSCGWTGHRRGVAACPNYSTPWRWQDHGKVWAP